MKYTQITCDQDIVPFLGRVVAIKSTAQCFTDDNRRAFACVNATPYKWRSGDIGPEVQVLYKPGENPSICYLMKCVYSNHPVYVRLATDNEISRLRDKVAADELHFNLHFGEKGIPERYPLHPEYDPEREWGMDIYNNGVTAILRPFSMDVTYEYDDDFLEEITDAKKNKRLPTGKVFTYYFVKYARGRIHPYTLEKTIDDVVNKWGGCKFTKLRFDVSSGSKLVIPGTSSSMMRAIAMNEPRTDRVIVKVLRRMVRKFSRN